MPLIQSRVPTNLFRSAVARPSILQGGYIWCSYRYSSSVQRRTLLSSLTHPRRLLPLIITPGNNPSTTFTRKMSSASAAAKRLHGKTILITGASSGIGRSTALEFARTNPSGDLRLIITARRKESLEELAAQIRDETKDGVKVLPVQLDVSKAEEIRGFVGGLPEEWRDIHVLVNNAYVSPLYSFSLHEVFFFFFLSFMND